MVTVNIFSTKNTEGRIDLARATSPTATAMFIYDVGPGEGSSPYHYESEEEWPLVVEGTVVVRTPNGEQTLERGDLVRLPAGPLRSAQGDEPEPVAREDVVVLAPAGPGISVYPDGDAIGVWAGEDNDLVFE